MDCGPFPSRYISQFFSQLHLDYLRSIIKQALCRPLMNLQSKSRRCLNILNDPPPFEQACIFGEICFICRCESDGWVNHLLIGVYFLSNQAIFHPCYLML